ARHGVLEGPNRRLVRARVAGQVELRCGVGLKAERGGAALLLGQQPGDVAVELTERPGRVGALHGRGHRVAGDRRAVTAGWRGLDGPALVPTCLVVAL